MKPAGFYEKADRATVRCTLCPHGCTIKSGKTGACGARRAQDGELFAESYGRITSLALDPIEKKPLHHFYPGSMILSLGSYGCNFRCQFCQNHEISMREAPWREISPIEIAALSLELAAKGNIGVAYTYNEPLIAYEFVRDCAELIHSQGQKNALVTNGFISEKPLRGLLPLIDAMNIDLKSFSLDFYKRIGGGLEAVKRTIEISANSCHVEVTTLIIPGENDSAREMDSLSAWLAGISSDIPLHISRFFPQHQMRDVPPTPVDTLRKLAETAKKHLKYVALGNC